MTPPIRELIGVIPYAETLGIEAVYDDGALTLLMPYIDSNVGNPALPALHGGAIGGFMEVCAVAQLILGNPNNSVFPKPIGINIDYLRRGKPVDTFARAEIFKQGSRVANVRVRAWQESFDKPIAALSGHFLLASPKDKTTEDKISG